MYLLWNSSFYDNPFKLTFLFFWTWMALGTYIPGSDSLAIVICLPSVLLTLLPPSPPSPPVQGSGKPGQASQYQSKRCCVNLTLAVFLMYLWPPPSIRVVNTIIGKRLQCQQRGAEEYKNMGMTQVSTWARRIKTWARRTSAHRPSASEMGRYLFGVSDTTPRS